MFEINICCYKCLKAKKSLKAKNVPGQKSKSPKVYNRDFPNTLVKKV